MRLSHPRNEPGKNETDGSRELRAWVKSRRIFASALVPLLKARGVETTQQTIHRWIWGDSRPTDTTLAALYRITGIAAIRWKTAVERKGYA